MNVNQIGAEWVGLDQIQAMLARDARIELSPDAVSRIMRCREYLDARIRNQQEPIYGVTTGFGSLCNHSISHADLGALQKNLVMSHACGMGEEVPERIVRLMLLLKIRSLSYGHSGVQLQTVQRLVDFYNHGVYPVVYTQGSLGASGDLAPLAHLSLPLLGLGEVNYQGERMPSAKMLQKLGLEAVELESKEGLALLNGTQFMAAYGVSILLEARRLNHWADMIGALSLEAYDGRIEPFLDQVHQVRNHQGQIVTAARIRSILKGSELIGGKKAHVQDPYSFRCIPQVHGASHDAIAYVQSVFENEINAVTDNPTLFPDDDLIVSAGNFHGQPLALALDFLGMALAELGNISERRVYRLISGTRRLPSFLVAHPGLNSGMMITQYTAASIVSQNKQFCMPASVDSIESSQGQEDHVSMGANAAVKTLKILENLQTLLGIELLNASQAMGFRESEKTSPALRKLLAEFGSQVPFISEDCVMHPLMVKAREFLSAHSPEGFLPD